MWTVYILSPLHSSGRVEWIKFSVLIKVTYVLFCCAELNPRALHMLGKHSTPSYIPSPWFFETGSHYVVQAG
jgi:hypothetical protein